MYSLCCVLLCTGTIELQKIQPILPVFIAVPTGVLVVIILIVTVTVPCYIVAAIKKKGTCVTKTCSSVQQVL